MDKLTPVAGFDSESGNGYKDVLIEESAQAGNATTVTNQTANRNMTGTNSTG